MTATISRPTLSNWETSDIPDLTGKTALITGANSGLGYSTAKALAEKNAHVIVACRSLEKATQSIKRLRASNSEGIFSPLELDLSDLNNVVEVQPKIFDDFENLDLLINNAGIMHPPKTLSAQGYEIQFAVNHLAHMLLTLKLLPIIEKKEESRIVTVTSGAQFFGKVGWKNLRAEKYYNKWESYSNSKLANVMFALELNENLKHKNILSLAAHPGIAKTNLFTAQKPKPSPIETFSMELFSPIFQSAEMGALPQLFAATSPEARGGDHYGPKFNFRGYPKLSPTSPFANNKKERKNLWEKSLEILNNFL
ncbi:oxidoreductase [Prochlorococcus marinus]|uniref:oxidoreductase n=1 Tax=Prochlorococcus marinus TaxID=1219 RepID=UPI001ADBA93B|nr:oxidoreductase [Prochlorococcus marinus]MBO8219687.1 SDR family NAD(P)-dependent oxidoreductase [Prochlorococcus marinus CUG1416]MBW3052057.1 light dependent protochlorophyllide oxido-reductase [Prochlorococcus marinus str. MU1416]